MSTRIYVYERKAEAFNDEGVFIDLVVLYDDGSVEVVEEHKGIHPLLHFFKRCDYINIKSYEESLCISVCAACAKDEFVKTYIGKV